jgi:hypothetical protein
VTVLGIAFSYDRALQLDGLLQSLILHCSDFPTVHLNIIYRVSSRLHASQYQQLREQYSAHTNVRFIEQTQFRRDVLQLLMPSTTQLPLQVLLSPSARVLLAAIARRQAQADHVLFLVDDSLFIRGFSCSTAVQALAQHPQALGVSLRLGANTNYCYAFDKSQLLPRFSPVGADMAVYDWTTAEGDFSYPLEVSSSIYRLRDIAPVVAGLAFSNPNQLESKLSTLTGRFARRFPWLLCFQTSVAFSAPANRVQSVMPNRSGTEAAYSSAALAQRFLAGERLLVSAYSGMVPRGCHQEVEFQFHNPSGPAVMGSTARPAGRG